MIPWWRHMAPKTWTRSTLIRTMSTKWKYSSMNLEASGHTQILSCRKWRLLLKWPIAVLFFVEKYLFIGLILMLWHRETHINPQRKPMNCRRPGGYQTHDLQTGATPPCSCQLSSTFVSCHWNRVKKHNANDMPEAVALDNWQSFWNAQVSISTPVIYICFSYNLFAWNN